MLRYDLPDSDGNKDSGGIINESNEI